MIRYYGLYARHRNTDKKLNHAIAKEKHGIDLVVGVFYGDTSDLSTHYKRIKRDYPVYIGQDFWYRLTGDINFYNELTSAIDKVATEYDGRDMLKQVITDLTREIEEAED